MKLIQGYIAEYINKKIDPTELKNIDKFRYNTMRWRVDSVDPDKKYRVLLILDYKIFNSINDIILLIFNNGDTGW